MITDVSVTSPEPGKVQIVTLLDGGEIPGNEILDAVLEVCNDRTVRPLTDQVSAFAPTKAESDLRQRITSTAKTKHALLLFSSR